jgi:hypothetical protein
MGKQIDRYQAWADAHIQAWAEGDVDAGMDSYSENCTYTAMNPFGDHRTVEGHEAMRQGEVAMAENWSDKKVIKNEVLSANNERGILHTWVSWTVKDGKEWACTFINIIHLDENDKCTKYIEWNVAKVKED